MPARLLFDVDTGVDDALALLLALGTPGTQVLGVGTVAGNVELTKCTHNTLRVLELAGRADVPVAAGCVRPLVQPLATAAHVHGDDGLGGVALPLPTAQATGEHAVDQIVRLARANAGQLTLIALGPLTNVAVALQREPDLPRLVKELVLMGGAFARAGNMSATAEFNVWVDPEAARSVFEAGFRTTIVPLDATMQAMLLDEHLDRLGGGQVARFVRDVTRDYMELYLRRYGRRAAAMHDPLATAVALDPSLAADAPELPVTVETRGEWTRGMTVADRRLGERPDSPPGRGRVVFRADADRFFEAFLDALRRLDGDA
ncbi:MAG TPA: nucleoside hydrolase [Chloroflexota bacterium]|jgi:purine nucleosidase|nr:nucleoside hydrolase [Chloroflexota bacterium]